MTASTSFTFAFAIFLLASIALRFWLATRQIRHVARHRAFVPPAFADKVGIQAHQKAADYTVVKTRFALIELAFGSAVLLGWTLLGGLGAINQVLMDWLGAGLLQQVALFGAFTLIGSAISLPFTLYETFVIEQRFGFNKMTLRLWIADLLKSTALGIAIGGPILALVLWVMGATGSTWWVWAWAVWLSVSLLAMVVYPMFIAPLFNKFEPLSDEALKTRVTNLLKRSGFTAKGLFVMDGSKRSAHSNAYFTGFGAAKRVVFYDTLVQRLSLGEMDAVLAHELGHLKHKHLVKRLALISVVGFCAFALLGYLSTQPWFYTGLGVRPNLQGPNDALALLLFMLALPVFSFFIGPVFAQLSRKHEFEADAYAVGQTSGADLSAALLKLHEDNASTLTPDPVYVKFYYSHPPASERLARMAHA
ncbi:M48 family metallopeptidase [Caenimonas sp. SL110]|uniref:M48 family metallopeptidase n=1 Tax=Caenimonas sp. SL110 TaxID=1450524 RepID=UPI0006544388|nr:M48 family metallopeptidase [Caenimonas sp. SL110]